MTTEAMIDVLRAHLNKEGLVICRAPDTQFALDGEREVQALRDIIELQLDTIELEAEWGEQHTTPVPPAILEALAKVTV